MNLLVRPNGTVEAIYSETLDLAPLGAIKIERASHVEPEGEGVWWAHIINGPSLGPYKVRSQAIAAEIRFLTEHLEKGACTCGFQL